MRESSCFVWAWWLLDLSWLLSYLFIIWLFVIFKINHWMSVSTGKTSVCSHTHVHKVGLALAFVVLCRKHSADFDTSAVINHQTLKAPRDVCLLYMKTTINQSMSFQQQVSLRLNSSSLPSQLKPGVYPCQPKARVQVSVGHTESWISLINDD